ncbi:DNRLRE domain-containing protein [Anaerofustis sp.]|uniref:DNRLRE domain-containing protein n=1 Tax=Anaerofustis sp. TaxID=1872517 RepID=UPI0025C58A0A|nr:DNRLRE domain-containing protein [Anaerofustis sp.]
MKKRLCAKSTALVLAFIMSVETVFLGLMPVINAAEVNDKNGGIKIEDTSKENKVIEKSEDYTVYKNEDGTRTIDMYTSEVRYKNEMGEYIDYDNSIVTMPTRRKRSVIDNYKYTNKEGMVDIKLPEDLTSDVPISIQDKDDNEVKFYPVFEKEVSKEETKGELKKETVEGIYYEREEKNTKIVYGSDEENIDIEYIPIDNGIKENIIINSPTDKNIFKYKIECEGMIPYIPEVGGVIFYDKNNPKEEIGAILTPYMTDSSENGGYSEDLKYSIEKTEEGIDTYILTLTVSKEYLESKDRVYPIIIDPTYTAKSTAGVKDVYIESGYPTSNFYVSTIRKMPIGYGSTDKVCRTLMKFPELNAKIKGNYVTSASLKLYELSNGSPFSTVEVHKNTSSWSLGEVTWNTRPKWTSTVYASKKLSNASSAHSLNITKLVQEWAKGKQANYGILLKASVESSSTKNYNSFHGTRSSSSSKRPTLSVTYTVPSPKPPAKASVTVNSASTIYLKKGTDLAVKWSGIKSNCLEAVQSRYIKYGADNVFDNATELKAYSSVGSAAASGTFTVPETTTSKWGEGRYAIGVRGIDKGGNKGSGTYCYIYIDKTAPKPVSNIKLSSSRSSSDSDEANVKVTYKINPDNPTVNPSGIKEHKIQLYNSKGVIGSPITVGASTNTATIANVPSGQTVYAKITTVDKSGNLVSVNSARHIISDMILPQIKDDGGFISNYDNNPWCNNTNKKDVIVSWDVDYKDGNTQLNLGKITVQLLNDKEQKIEGYDETNLTFEDNIYPKQFKNYNVNKIIKDFDKLKEGKYQLSFKFYASDNKGYDEALISYNKDLTPPSVTITKPTQNEILKQMAQISFDAQDDKSGSGEIYKKKILLIDNSSKENLLTETLDIFNLNTTEYDAGEYKIKVIVEDMAGNTSEDTKTVFIKNPPPTPIVSFDKAFSNDGSNIKLNYNWIKGDESISNVDHIEYVIDDISLPWKTIENSNPNVDINTRYDVKSVLLNESDLAQGTHTFYFVSVDENGEKGNIRELKYVLDKKNPEVNISSPANNFEFINMLYIKGEIADDNLTSYNIYVASKENPTKEDYTLVKKVLNSKNKDNIQGNLAVINLSDNEKYPSGSKYSIKISAIDNCGNITEKEIIVQKREVIEHAADFTVEKNGDYNNKNDAVIVENEKEEFKLKDLSNNDYIPTSLDYFINGKKIQPNEDGKIDFSDEEKYFDDSIHSLLIRDNAQDKVQYSSSSYEYSIFKNIKAEDEIFENTIKENGEIKLENGKNEGSYVLNYSNENLNENILSLKLLTDEDIIDEGNIEYYIKINNNDFIKIESDKEYLLDKDLSNNDLKLNKIQLKAVLKSNTLNNVKLSSISVDVKASSGDILKIDMMNKFNPTYVTVQSGINYRTKISWDIKTEDKDVTYDIYRCDGDVYDDKQAYIVQSGVTDNFWYDNYTIVDQYSNANNEEGVVTRSSVVNNYDKDFTYKVVAVKPFKDTYKRSSGTIGNVTSHVMSFDEYTRRLGIKDYWGYFDIETPISNGHVEQSMGNFVYSQSDGSVTGQSNDINMERVYNSLSTSSSTLGIGWDFGFNHILLETYNEYDDVTGMVYKDGSGTIFTFLNSDNIKPKEKIDEQTGNIIEEETTYKSPYGEYIILKKIETIDAHDVDNDNDTSEIIDEIYTIKTRDGLTCVFDRNCQITYMTDRNGNSVIYRYFNEDVKESKETNLDYRKRGKKGFLSEVEILNSKSEKEFNEEYEALQNKTEEEQKEFKNKRSIITFEYNEHNLIERINMPHGKYSLYEYKDVSFGLGKKRKVLSKVTNYTYDNNNIVYNYDYSNGSNLTKFTDAKGNEYLVEYYNNEDNMDMIKKVTYPNKEAKSFEYIKAKENNIEVQDFDSTIEYTHKNNNMLQDINNFFTSKDNSIISDTVVKYDKDGKTIYNKDSLGKETYTYYQGNNTVKTVSYADTYNIDGNGTINKNEKEMVNITKYDNISNDSELGNIASSKGNIIKEESSDGTVTIYKYESEEFDASSDITYIDGIVTSDNEYEYDKNGNLLKEYDDVTKDGIIREYDETGQIINESNIVSGNNTNSTHYTYDEKGNILTEQTVGGNETRDTQNVYDEFSRVIKETDAKGYSTMYVYDGYDRIIKTIKNTKPDNEPEGNKQIITENRYDENGSLIYEKKEDGSEISYEYDNMNRLIKTSTVKNGVENISTTSYNYASGKENEFIIGQESKIYDFLYKETNTENGIESISYLDVNRQTVKEYSRGVNIYSEYNDQGQIIKTFTIQDDAEVNDGIVTFNLYDEKGNNICTVENPLYNEQEGTYRVDSENSLVTKMAYDNIGNKISQTDPMGNTIKYTYSLDNKKSSVILQEGNETKLQANIKEGDNTKNVTINALGNKSEEVIDSFGNTVEIRDIGKGSLDEKRIVTKYEYDKNDNKVKEIYQKGDYKTFIYDFEGKLIKEEHFTKDNHKVEDISYEYDLAGNSIKSVQNKYDLSNNKVSSRYIVNGYDERNRLISCYEGEKENPLDNEKILYTYNDKDEIVKIIYPNAEKGIKEVIYEYNKYGQVINIKAVTTSDNKEKLISEYTYNPKGTIKNVKDYTGFDVGNDNYILKTYEYDKFDRITNIKYVNSDNLEKIREEYKFTYDKNGNILTEEIYNDYIIDNKIHKLKLYSYDELGRLIEVQVIDKLNENNKETTSYEYDKVGNRISETKQGITSTYSYNNLNQLLDVKAQGNTLREYTYDENGNTKTEKQGDKTVTYSYDINNQIIDYEEKDNGNVVLIQHNDYDANSQRIRKEVKVNEEESTVNYHYDRGSVLYTTDIDNNKISENISDSEMTIRFNNGGISAYKLNSDYKGSVTTIINEQNNGICGYKYDEFGNTEMIGDTNFNNEVCYTGQIYDKETGNYYYNARYYNPQNGRFITMDTYRGELEEPLSLHLYAYCANDPINYTDPSGHSSRPAKNIGIRKNKISSFKITLKYHLYKIKHVFGKKSNLKYSYGIYDQRLSININQIKGYFLSKKNSLNYAKKVISNFNDAKYYTAPRKYKNVINKKRAHLISNRSACFGSMNATRIAAEIYAHACVYYGSKALTGSNFSKLIARKLKGHAKVADVNYGDSLTSGFWSLWNNNSSVKKRFKRYNETKKYLKYFD